LIPSWTWITFFNSPFSKRSLGVPLSKTIHEFSLIEVFFGRGGLLGGNRVWRAPWGEGFEWEPVGAELFPTEWPPKGSLVPRYSEG